MASISMSTASDPGKNVFGATAGIGPFPPSEDSNAATEITGTGGGGGCGGGGGLFRGMYFTVVAVSKDADLSKRASQVFRSVRGTRPIALAHGPRGTQQLRMRHYA